MDPVDHFSNLQVDVSSLPKYEEVELLPLAPKYLLKLHISTTISFLFFMGGAVIAYSFLQDFRGYLLVLMLLFFVIFGWSYFSNYQLMKRNGYALRQKDIIFRRGFLFQKTTVVPFNRIQHVSVERGVIDKALNLATLKIYTAGGSGSDLSIPGLLPETAFSLKEELSNRMSGHV
ncbi:MAG: PH domain-containing protein [Salinimicrobium sp.]